MEGLTDAMSDSCQDIVVDKHGQVVVVATLVDVSRTGTQVPENVWTEEVLRIQLVSMVITMVCRPRGPRRNTC